MSYNKNEKTINEDQIASFLSDALNNVESDKDPEILNILKKIYKKNIPFSRRMYVAAWLVKQATSNGYKGSSRYGHNDRSSRYEDRGRMMERNGRNDRNSRNDKNSRGTTRFEDRQVSKETHSERSSEVEANRTERAPRVQIDPSMATTIFIGIGRNRRVFPRDLVGLLVSVANLDRDRIGDIRVLANYSFIQLFTEDCEKAISALNGYDYRGRKLSVSYSRQKDDNEEGVQNSIEKQNVAPVVQDDIVPKNISNEAHSDFSETSESSKIAEDQKHFAEEQSQIVQQQVIVEQTTVKEEQFSETTDDGQVKSHFCSGDTTL